MSQPVSNDFTAFVAELRPALVAFFQRRCGQQAEAEDLAQDVIVRALSHADWESAEQAKGYIFRIAVNRWHDRGRDLVAQRARVEWDDETVQRVPEEISFERSLISQDQVRFLRDVIMEMNERTRDVFILSRFEQIKQSEIAETLGISLSTVEKHLVKAVAHLTHRVRKNAFKG